MPDHGGHTVPMVNGQALLGRRPLQWSDNIWETLLRQKTVDIDSSSSFCPFYHGLCFGWDLQESGSLLWKCGFRHFSSVGTGKLLSLRSFWGAFGELWGSFSGVFEDFLGNLLGTFWGIPEKEPFTLVYYIPQLQEDCHKCWLESCCKVSRLDKMPFLGQTAQE